MGGRDLVVGFARDLAVDEAFARAAFATDPALGAYASAAHAYGSARGVYRGTRGLRHESGRSHDRVVSAGEWFHGPADRSAAVAQLATDYQTLTNDLAQVATSPDDAAWTLAVIVPTLEEWRAFVHRVTQSDLASWVTEWTVFETWAERLRRLRELARARGIALESADPVPLPKTIWQRGAGGDGSRFDLLFALLRTVVYGAIAVTGAIGFYSVVRDVRRGMRSDNRDNLET